MQGLLLTLVLVGVVLAVGLWNWQLRAAVRRRTRELRAAVADAEEAHQKLSKSQAELLSILHSTSDGLLGVSYTDRGPVVIFANEQFGRIFGLDPKATVGQLDADVRESAKHCFKDPEAFQQEVRRLYEERDATQCIELEVVSPNPATIERYTGPLVNGDGRIIGRVWSFREVTERKRLEHNLRMATKMEAIGTLAAGMAHQFNNLLTGIMGHASLGRTQRGLDESLRTAFDGIEGAARRAADLTNKLLAFARGGRYNAQLSSVNDLAEQVRQHLAGRVPPTIEIRVTLAADAPQVELDPGQVHEALLAISANALEAMGEGGTLTIETRRAEMDESFIAAHAGSRLGSYALLAMSDNGSGIDSEIQKKIFEPFFTTKGAGRSTGLGLAMVYGVMKAHKGYVNVESARGRGTRVELYFPVAPAAAATRPERRPSKMAMASAGQTILVVDDEAIVRRVLRRMLERLGYRVLDASGGYPAIEIFEEAKNNIDLVMLDIVMPDLDGHATFQRLRKIRPDVRVLLSSGHSADGLAQDMLTEGALDMLQKPYSMEELAEAVRNALGVELAG